MWPWTRIRELEQALYDEQRENRMLGHRAEWLEDQWTRTKHELKKAQKIK
jgi:hypothetical protein